MDASSWRQLVTAHSRAQGPAADALRAAAAAGDPSGETAEGALGDVARVVTQELICTATFACACGPRESRRRVDAVVRACVRALRRAPRELDAVCALLEKQQREPWCCFALRQHMRDAWAEMLAGEGISGGPPARGPVPRAPAASRPATREKIGWE